MSATAVQSEVLVAGATGTVIGTNNDKRFSFIKRPTGPSVFCFWGSVLDLDDVGRRYVQDGEQVKFDIVAGRKSLAAINVKILSPRSPIDVANWWEEGEALVKDDTTITRGYSFGFIRRPFSSDAATLHWRDVLSCYTKTISGCVRFHNGQRWRYEVRPPQASRCSWEAFNAEELPETGA